MKNWGCDMDYVVRRCLKLRGFSVKTTPRQKMTKTVVLILKESRIYAVCGRFFISKKRVAFGKVVCCIVSVKGKERNKKKILFNLLHSEVSFLATQFIFDFRKCFRVFRNVRRF